MGCDIHMYVEVNDGISWQKVGDVFLGPYGEGGMSDSPYRGRNYDLFAILANVRNGYGFAGVKTGKGFVPISLPKGLPVDVSTEIREESDSWGVDGHSHSWLTLKELKEYAWGQTTEHQGYVSVGEYIVFKQRGKPYSWCGSVGGRNTRTLTNDQMEDLIQSRERKDCYYYTLVKWTELYSVSCDNFLTQTIPALESLGPPDRVRIVFWFDN